MIITLEERQAFGAERCQDRADLDCRASYMGSLTDLCPPAWLLQEDVSLSDHP